MSQFDHRIVAFSAGERFFAASPDALCVIDGEARLRLVNAAWEAALGWRLTEVVNRPVAELLHADDVAHVDRLGAQSPKPGEIRDGFVRFRHAGGDYRSLHWRVLLRDEGLAYVRVRDVSVERRRRAHADLIETATGVGSWEVDLVADTIYWSPQTYRIHGLEPSSAQVPLEKALAFYPEPARTEISAAIADLVETGRPHDLELPFVTAQGARRWVRATAVAQERSGRVVRAHGTLEDITAARAERERLRRLSAVAAATSNAVVLCDADMRIEWVNPAFELLTGHAAAEAVGQSCFALLRCDAGGAEALADIDRAIAGGAGVTVRMISVAKDGRSFWSQVDLQPMEGPAPGFICVLADVTELTNAERRMALAEREAREARSQLLHAVEALSDGFALFDTDDRLVLCNQRYRDLHPRSAGTLGPGRRRAEILRASVDAGDYQVAPAQRDDYVAERLRRRDGDGPEDLLMADGRWLRVDKRRTADGGLVSLRVDISELKNQQTRLADIIDAAAVGTWELSQPGGEIRANARWAEMLGLELEEIQPITLPLFESLVHPDDLPKLQDAFLEHEAGDTDMARAEFRIRHADGDWRWVLSSGRIVARDADGAARLVVGAHFDVTDRRAREDTLEQAKHDAEEASRAKSRFLANMSHEIRTPMNGVLGVAEVLDRRVKDPEHRRMIGVIRESGEALLTVINDILDFSKIEAGKMTLERRPFSPASLLERVESLHSLKAQEKRIALRAETVGDAARNRVGDEHRIVQILHNLVSNAVKFTNEGSVEITLDCADETMMTMIVRDSGIGMSAEQVARVFEDFIQADDSTTRKFGGTGLGMAIVRQLSQTMGGDVALQSAPGEGTTVTAVIEAPLATQETAGDDRGVHAAALPPGLKVLAADDNAVNRFVLEAMLESFKADITMVDGGVPAVEAARAGDFDLIMLDISMPDMDGTEALTTIRDEEAAAGRTSVPAVAVTAHALTHQVEEYLAFGFAAHVAKPIKPANLYACIAQALADRGYGR